MVFLYYRHRRDAPQPAGRLATLPRVTVQLPIYNEVYVVERLVESVAAIDYPRERLEIQILDDSDDDTRDVALALTERLAARGFAITPPRPRTPRRIQGRRAPGRPLRGVRRIPADPGRRLRPGTGHPEGLSPLLRRSGVGMVQARWGHLNRDFSRLTRIQAILLDGHFVIEHTGPAPLGRFFNFNGTAGVWRRSCIEESGGWQADTLTEDLDLSYRAQLAGWKFVYLKDCVAPAEVPVDMNGLKSQQHRWTKGSIQTGRKLLPAIWRSALPWKIKIEAFFHLTNNLSYVLVVLLALLLVPAILIRDRIGWQKLAMLDFPLFFGATLSFLAFYVSSQREIGRGWKSTLRCLPLLLSLGIGISVNNARAVLEALLRRPTGFTRTPKYSIEGERGEWRTKKYRAGWERVHGRRDRPGSVFPGVPGVRRPFGYWIARALSRGLLPGLRLDGGPFGQLLVDHSAGPLLSRMGLRADAGSGID
jgi:cellulose synthase/poly-beta-1,6-N-acetylglucosamine synthase-like glycosyltransferase